MRHSFRIPWRARPKKRPRVTRRGTYMPKDYREWKSNVADYLAAVWKPKPPLDSPVAVEIVMRSDRIEVQIIELDELWRRPKYLRGDIDNLAGGVLDAMQEAGVISDDRHVVKLRAVAAEKL